MLTIATQREHFYFYQHGADKNSIYQTVTALDSRMKSNGNYKLDFRPLQLSTAIRHIKEHLAEGIIVKKIRNKQNKQNLKMKMRKSVISKKQRSAQHGSKVKTTKHVTKSHHQSSASAYHHSSAKQTTHSKHSSSHHHRSRHVHARSHSHSHVAHSNRQRAAKSSGHRAHSAAHRSSLKINHAKRSNHHQATTRCYADDQIYWQSCDDNKRGRTSNEMQLFLIDAKAKYGRRIKDKSECNEHYHFDSQDGKALSELHLKNKFVNAKKKNYKIKFNKQMSGKENNRMAMQRMRGKQVTCENCDGIKQNVAINNVSKCMSSKKMKKRTMEEPHYIYHWY